MRRILREVDSGLFRALMGFLLLGLIVCGPVWTAPTQRILGHPGADAYNHVWGYWHVAQALQEGRSLLDAHLLGWPEGGVLWFIDSFGAFLTLPFQWLGGAALSFNVMVLANVVFAGVAAWALGRRVTGSGVAAVVTGVSFALMPHLLAQLHNGITETTSVGWIPLVALLGIRFFRAPTTRRGVALGLAWAACSLACWYYGLFAGLLLGVCALHVSPDWKKVSRACVWPLGVVSVLVGPFAWRFARTLSVENALVQREVGQVAQTLSGHDVVDALALVVPGAGVDRKLLFDEDLLVGVYVGLALLLCALLGAAWRKSARLWIAGALLSAVLSLGAWLHWGGELVVLPGGGGFPLPFLLLSRLPGFETVSHAYRFAVLTHLFLGVAAAFGVLEISRRIGWGQVGIAALVSVFVGVESLSVGPYPLPTSVVGSSAAYASIEGDGAVLDLPAGIQVLSRGRYAMYQMDHGRPIVYALDDPTPEFLLSNRLTRYVLNLERTSVDSLAPSLPYLELALARRQLAQQGLSAIVVHEALYPAEMLPRIRAFLDTVLGEGRRVDGLVVYGI
ncbi:MAG: hypothetical protein VX519_06490 [Myxococcota bacterium]|nr:hypothetical protein [Myxococcota bacterium]